MKWTTKKNKFPQMKTELENLNGSKVTIGVFGEQAWLAGIHEYGCVITPKNAKYLTVPCNPKAKGKKAGEFPDLFFYESESGTKFLARPKGKDGIEILYILMSKVQIPERAFLRGGHDANIDEVLKKMGRQVNQVLSGKMSANQLLQAAGLLLSSAIKDYARDLNSPPNHWATTETKTSDNPLVDTGEMIRALTYKVE